LKNPLEGAAFILFSINLLWSDEANAVLDEVNLLLDPGFERIHSDLGIVFSLMNGLLNIAHLVSNGVHLFLFIQNVFDGEQEPTNAKIRIGFAS
jgi:hypothetical protein